MKKKRRNQSGYDIQPIRDKAQIQAMAAVLKAKDPKYWAFFMLGIHTGLRISDILALRVKDVRAMTKITEKKTNKRRYLYLSDENREKIEEYIRQKGLSDDDYLIPSRKHDKDGNIQPLSRYRAFVVLKEAAAVIGADPQTVGTHSLRKTFGFHFYESSNGDIGTLMYIFNHSSERVTLRYIGVTDKRVEEQLANFQLL